MANKLYKFISIMTLAIYGMFFWGCNNKKAMEAMLNSWLGRPESELVSSFGPPTSTYTASDGNKTLKWHLSSGYTSFNNAYTSQLREWFCDVTITVNPNGTISNWKWYGNNCR